MRAPPPPAPPKKQDNQDKKAADSWPMLGGTPSRNMVNLVDKNTPITWSVEEGKQKNIKWQVQLGDHSMPVR